MKIYKKESEHTTVTNMNKRKFEELEAECTDTDSTETDEEDEQQTETDPRDKGKEKEPDPTELKNRKKPKKPFRINARQLALTYPKCPLPRETVFDQLLQKLGDPTEYLIAQETHKVITVLTAKDAYDQFVQECMSKYEIIK